MKLQMNKSIPSFTRVLLAIDFSAASNAALETAVRICRHLQKPLLVLHVFEYCDVLPAEPSNLPMQPKEHHLRATHHLEKALHTIHGAGIDCEGIMQGGLPATTILDTTKARNVDLVILGTHALRGLERLVFGSTADAVLRQAACPVLTIGPHCTTSLDSRAPEGPVVFATDFNLTTTSAIRYAATFCTMTGSPLHCLHVLPESLEGQMRSRMIPGVMAQALQHVAIDSGIKVEPSVCAVTFDSEISLAILDYAQRQKARGIVFGIRQRSMLVSHLPPHIVYKIISAAPSCSNRSFPFTSRHNT